MKVDYTVEEISSIKKKVLYTISKKTVTEEIENAYAILGRNANIRGFRKGKVPTHILEKKFGASINDDVVKQLISKGFASVELDFDIIGQPNIVEEDVGTLKKNQNFTFSVMVETKPNLEIENYLNMEVPYDAPEISDEEVDSSVEATLSRESKWVEADQDFKIDNQSKVLAQITLSQDGEEKHKEESTMVNISFDRFYPGLESLFEGLTIGESQTGSVTIAESSVLDDIKGNTYDASVSVVSIQVKRAPSVEDYVSTKEIEGGVDAFREDIRSNLFSRKEEGSKNQSRIFILQKLVEQNQIDVPQGFIDMQLRDLLEELAMRQAYMGKDPREIQFDEEQINNMRVQALFAARASCILDSIAQKENLSISEEEFQEKLKEMAMMRGQTPQAIQSYLKEEGTLENFKTRVLEEKTLNWVLDHASLVAPEVVAPPETIEQESTELETSATETSQEETTQTTPSHIFSMKNKKSELVAAVEALGESASGKTKEQLLAVLDKKS